MVKIALIDSGVCLDLINSSSHIMQVIGDSAVPHIHGSSMAQIILNHNQDVMIYSFEILNEKLRCSIDELVDVLRMTQEIDADIIHMSLGITQFDVRLYKICQEIYKRNRVIVSAYSNYHNTSFPAEFDFVKGIRSFLCGCKNDYYYEKETNSIYGFGAKQRIPFQHYVEYGKGNSCAAAHFTGIYSKEMQKRKFSKKIINQENRNMLMNHTIPDLGWVRRELYYPLNMQVIKMIKERNMKVVGIYDLQYNKYTIDGIRIFSDLEKGLSEAETLVLGDNEKLSLDEDRQEKRKLIKKAFEYNKNVFCISNIDREMDKDLFDEAQKKGLKFHVKYC